MKKFTKIFETDRLYVRPFKLTDADDTLAFYGDSEVLRFVSGGEAWCTEANKTKIVKLNIKHYSKERGFGLWAIVLKTTNRVIGQASLKRLDHRDEFDLGYILAKDFWNQGFATEVAKGLIHYAFEKKKLDRVVAITSPENKNSIKVLLKCGMTHEGQTKAYGWDVEYFVLKKPSDSESFYSSTLKA